jgi:hypothetical protein
VPYLRVSLINPLIFLLLCRTFELNHLAQIKHLAYNMRPIRVMHEGQRIESLLIGFPEEDKQPTEPTRTAHSGQPFKSDKIATSAQIEDRKLSFHNKLLDLVSASHEVRARATPFPLPFFPVSNSFIP